MSVPLHLGQERQGSLPLHYSDEYYRELFDSLLVPSSHWNAFLCFVHIFCGLLSHKYKLNNW